MKPRIPGSSYDQTDVSAWLAEVRSRPERPVVRVQRLPRAEGLDLPRYATVGAAGLDLLAALDNPKTLWPGERALIPTGLCVAIPAGFEMQIRPRSGLAYKHGIAVLNSPGTIDSDYRGEINVLLFNADAYREFEIERGMRIAQAVLAPVVRLEWREVADLDETQRGAGGFGSTGR